MEKNVAYWRLRVKTKFGTIITAYDTLDNQYATARKYCLEGFWWGAPASGKAKYYPPNSIEIIEAWRPARKWDGTPNKD